jgi:FecR protein
MSHDPPSNRLHELLEHLANETLTREQHTELQEVLRENPLAQTRYLAFIDLHLGLRSLVGEGKTTPLSVLPEAGRRGWNIHAKQWQLLSLAAILIVAVFIGPYFIRHGAHEIAQSELVHIQQSASAEFFRQSVPPIAGTLEYAHEYALTNGLLELRFPNGAEVILEAPSVFEIAARDSLMVKVGACSVHAPLGAEGFRVETPQVAVVDRGTRFSVNANEFGETVVQVLEGAADVQSPTAARATNSQRLTQGDSLRFSEKADGTSQALPFNPAGFRRSLPDRVVSYAARANQDGNVDELLRVTVQRGGREFTYPVGDLIGVEVVSFCAGTNGHNLTVSPDQATARVEVLESDALLNTGLVNPGGSQLPLKADPDVNTPGLAVRFRRPISNGPGPDLVWFELQSVVDPPEGDAFHISPLHFSVGLQSYTVKRYDITMLSSEAHSLATFELRFFAPPPLTLTDLLNNSATLRRPPLRFRALAVGIDLSELGYAERAEVSGLFFQDALDDSHQVDPTFIAGFPVELTHEVAP